MTSPTGNRTSRKQNFRYSENSEDKDFYETWKDLEKGIKQIFLKEKQSLHRTRYVELYSRVYNYCTRHRTSGASPVRKKFKGQVAGGPQDLYEKIRNFLTSYLDKVLQKCADMRNEDLLNSYATHWQEYQFCSKVLDGMCSYLNRDFLTRVSQEASKEFVCGIYQLALVLWSSVIRKPLHRRLLDAMLQLIRKERNGERINTNLLKSTTDCYVELGLNVLDATDKRRNLHVYKEFFEIPFLSDTGRFYTMECTDLIRQNPIAVYMKQVESILSEEQRRVHVYMHYSTLDVVLKSCTKTLVEKHLDLIFAEFHNLMDEGKSEDLARMFKLISSVPLGLEKLRDLLEEHISSRGATSIEQCGEAALTDNKLFVNTVLRLSQKYRKLISTAFGNDAGFVAAFDKACGKFINDNAVTRMSNSPNKSSELLAKYCDIVLKKSTKNSEELELEDTLNHVMMIFKYIKDKDVFQKYYMKMLAKRLVQNTSASHDAELSMIGKLKQACGFEYTAKLQRMFLDVGVSKDLNEQFKRRLSKFGDPLGLDFSIQVLSSGTWPFKQSLPFSLPYELEKCITWFTRFYNRKHSGRKLQWLYNLSKCEIVANCFKNRYTFQASTFQMAVLLLYNHSDNFTIQSLQERTQIQMEMLLPVIQILLKSKLLITDAEVNNLQPCSIVSLYFGYNNKKFRVNINAPVRTEVKTEQEATDRQIVEERKCSIQAAIVRIMKTRKVLKHQQLLIEVINQLSEWFQPQPHVIKKCIDILIEKEYLERLEEKDIYGYLA